jgi:hypothetical protein
MNSSQHWGRLQMHALATTTEARLYLAWALNQLVSHLNCHADGSRQCRQLERRTIWQLIGTRTLRCGACCISCRLSALACFSR